MKRNNILKLVVVIAVSEFAGILGSLFTTQSIPTWYAALAKPALNPPNWVFGPVWATLYLLMAIAAFLVWRRGSENKYVKFALCIFCLQLLLNTLWSIVFFGLHAPWWAFVNIVLLWAAIAWTMVAFRKISHTAFYLLVPYLIWVSFAAYLNLAIAILNH